MHTIREWQANDENEHGVDTFYTAWCALVASDTAALVRPVTLNLTIKRLWQNAFMFATAWDMSHKALTDTDDSMMRRIIDAVNAEAELPWPEL